MAKVAIVGRPNVGKSSLFNRILGRREAIVADMPGVTRDVKTSKVETLSGRSFTLLDTGGLWSGDEWEKAIQEKVAAAIHDVDLVLFCVDGRSELTRADREIAQWLRATKKDVLLIATKMDDAKHEESAEFFDLYTLGFGEPYTTSAEHGKGILDLQDLILSKLPEDDGEPDETPVRVAIIGRPNVGKSSLLNAIVGDERVIVADYPGTTRDAIDVEFSFAGRPFVLVDTAGIRRKPEGDVEYYTKLRSEEAIRRCDVAILVVDPFELGDHEMRLANVALEVGKPIVMAINKWDLVTDEQLKPFEKKIAEELAHIYYSPKVYTSAKTDYGLHEVLATAIRLYDQTRQRISTGELNSWVEIWTQRQTPPNFQGKLLKIYYISQPEVAPPTFVMSVNNEQFITRAYEQYLLNRIHEDLGFPEVPVRLVFKSRNADGGKRVRT